MKLEIDGLKIYLEANVQEYQEVLEHVNLQIKRLLTDDLNSPPNEIQRLINVKQIVSAKYHQAKTILNLIG